MAVTIRDVAKAAGVSASTVSRAIALPHMVDAGTRQRVLQAAESLGYQPNRAARGLITGRTGNLGLVVPDLANPFFPSVVKGIQSQAHEDDYAVFLADTDEVPSAEIGLVRALAKQVDGIILCSPRMSATELREAAAIAPTVLVNRRAADLPAITIDNVGGMRQIVTHLVRLGHHRIGHVAGPRTSWSGRERLRGLRRACLAADIELVEIGHFAPQFDGGAEAAAAVRASGVTAVVAYNDLVALGVISGLRALRVLVPRQVSVVGVDDIPTAGMVQPPLTTLSIPKEKAGRAAVELLLQVLSDPDRRTRPRRELATELLVRQTTAAPHN